MKIILFIISYALVGSYLENVLEVTSPAVFMFIGTVFGALIRV